MSQSEREDRIDDAIECWHSLPEGERGVPLIEFLGWTAAEYAAYVEHNILPPERGGAL